MNNEEAWRSNEGAWESTGGADRRNRCWHQARGKELEQDRGQRNGDKGDDPVEDARYHPELMVSGKTNPWFGLFKRSHVWIPHRLPITKTRKVVV